MKYIVYQTINLINNFIYIGVHQTANPEEFDGYIGCGVNINHPSSYKYPKTKFLFAVNKYGIDKFKRTILKVFDIAENAYKLEAELVDTEFLKRKDVYNMLLGGDNTPKGHYEYPIYQFNYKGEFIRKFSTTSEAAEAINCPKKTLSDSVSTKVSCRGYIWSRTDTIDPSIYTFQVYQPCYMYDCETKCLVKVYDTVKQASDSENISYHLLSRAIQTGERVYLHYYSHTLYDEFPEKKTIKLGTLYVYDLDGKYVTTLKGTKEIAKFFDLKSVRYIHTVLRRKNKIIKNYQITTVYLDNLEPSDYINPKKRKPINVYSLDGTFIEQLPSVMEMRRKYGHIAARVLKGKRKVSKGKIFEYAEN